MSDITFESFDTPEVTYAEYRRFKDSLDDPEVAVRLAYRLDCTGGLMHFKKGWDAARFRTEFVRTTAPVVSPTAAEKSDADELPRGGS